MRPLVFAHLVGAGKSQASVEVVPTLAPVSGGIADEIESAALALAGLLRASAERSAGIEPGVRAAAGRLAGGVVAACAVYAGAVRTAASAAGGDDE